MVVPDIHTKVRMESSIMLGEQWVWGDVRENGEDKLIREFENCGNWMG
jgi:hypothetical protein